MISCGHQEGASSAGLIDAGSVDGAAVRLEADGGVEAPDASIMDGSKSDAGKVRWALCPDVEARLPRPRGLGTRPGAASPFGPGLSLNVVLGGLEGTPDLAPIAPGAVATSEDLDGVTYDVYVPPSYDGTEPHGLITFINSGNNGGGPDQRYRQLFASEKLIQVAADGAGNSVGVAVRMGRALLGAVRAMELFNVDETRIYAMGNSGGARTANMLAYQYPELFAAALPRCGANYPRIVEQAYETHMPDSNYEFWGDAYFPMVDGRPYLSYLRDRALRFALMVSFDDFREGDVFNIYHHGMEADGLLARLLETSGGHCATSAAHFRDALGFVEHPFHAVAKDDFDDGDLALGSALGQGVFALRGAVEESGGALKLGPSSGGAAAIVADRVRWRDRYGLIFRAQLTLLGSGIGTVGVWPYRAEVHSGGDGQAPAGRYDDGDSAGFLLSIVRARNETRAEVWIRRGASASELLFSAPFEAPVTSTVDLKLEAWDAELQLDLGVQLDTPTTLVSGVRRLDDGRTIRVRWAELPEGPLDSVWSPLGSVVTLAFEGTEGGLAVDRFSATDGAGFQCR